MYLLLSLTSGVPSGRLSYERFSVYLSGQISFVHYGCLPYYLLVDSSVLQLSGCRLGLVSWQHPWSIWPRGGALANPAALRTGS